MHSSLLGFRDLRWQKNGTIIFNIIVFVFIWYSIMKCLTFLCSFIFHHHGGFFSFFPLVLFCCVVHVMKCGCASLKSSHLTITYFSCSLTTQVGGLFIIILNCALPVLFMWCCLVAQVHRALQQKRGILQSKYHRKQQRKKFLKTHSCEPQFLANS